MQQPSIFKTKQGCPAYNEGIINSISYFTPNLINCWQTVFQVRDPLICKLFEWKAKNHQLKQLLANFLLCFECKCNVSVRDFLVSDDKFPTCLFTVLFLKYSRTSFNTTDWGRLVSPLPMFSPSKVKYVAPPSEGPFCLRFKQKREE